MGRGMRRYTPGSGTQNPLFYGCFDLLLARIMQSLSLSHILFSIPSSSSSSISGVIALVIRFFFDFPFNVSASTSSISSRISFVLKTNFPLIATRFPFLRSLRTYKSSLALVSSFYKRAFSEIVLLRADSDYSIYRFIGVIRVEERTIELTSDVASYSSISFSSELSSRERSRSFGIIISGRVI
jgi:hypothetical protein